MEGGTWYLCQLYLLCYCCHLWLWRRMAWWQLDSVWQTLAAGHNGTPGATRVHSEGLSPTVWDKDVSWCWAIEVDSLSWLPSPPHTWCWGTSLNLSSSTPDPSLTLDPSGCVRKGKNTISANQHSSSSIKIGVVPDQSCWRSEKKLCNV